LIFPTKFVKWDEVVEWSWRLASKVKESTKWKPQVIVGVGRGGYVVSRILCDLLDVENLVAIPIKWQELKKKGEGERYLADLIRVYARASDVKTIDEGIARVVAGLKPIVTLDQKVDLKGQYPLLVEEIVATGMHLKMAKEILEEKWNAGEIKTATLIWKAPTAAHTPDFYIVKPGKFVWFQFPWSRLSDYVQFLKVMLVEESKRDKKFVWSTIEVEEKFAAWYGARPDRRYLKEALNVLERYEVVKLLSSGEISVTVPTN